MSDAQLPLSLPHRPALGRQDFLTAPCNAEAVAWLERWPDWPSHALALAGPEGCGKTHLLHAFAESREGVCMTDAPDLSVDKVGHLAESHAVVVLDRLEAGFDETALFHLWNLTKENRRYLLMAGRLAPARLHVALPDLASRLSSVAVAEIRAPDESLLAAVLVKLFADRQLKVGMDVVTYVLSRAERSFAAINAVVCALDRASLVERKPVTIPLARTVLAMLEQGGSQ